MDVFANEHRGKFLRTRQEAWLNFGFMEILTWEINQHTCRNSFPFNFFAALCGLISCQKYLNIKTEWFKKWGSVNVDAFKFNEKLIKKYCFTWLFPWFKALERTWLAVIEMWIAYLSGATFISRYWPGQEFSSIATVLTLKRVTPPGRPITQKQAFLNNFAGIWSRSIHSRW